MTEKIVSIAFLGLGLGSTVNAYADDKKKANDYIPLNERELAEKAVGYAMSAALLFAGATLWKHSD